MSDEMRDAAPVSVTQIMRNSLPARPADYVLGNVLSRKALSGKTVYSYCPFCVERVKRGGGDYKTELRPLWSVTYKNLYRADERTGKIVFEKEYECPVCKDTNGYPRRITVDDFIDAYCAKRSAHLDSFISLDPDSVRRAGFQVG